MYHFESMASPSISSVDRALFIQNAMILVETASHTIDLAINATAMLVSNGQLNQTADDLSWGIALQGWSNIVSALTDLGDEYMFFSQMVSPMLGDFVQQIGGFTQPDNDPYGDTRGQGLFLAVQLGDEMTTTAALELFFSDPLSVPEVFQPAEYWAAATSNFDTLLTVYKNNVTYNVVANGLAGASTLANCETAIQLANTTDYYVDFLSNMIAFNPTCRALAIQTFFDDMVYMLTNQVAQGSDIINALSALSSNDEYESASYYLAQKTVSMYLSDDEILFTLVKILDNIDVITLLFN